MKTLLAFISFFALLQQSTIQVDIQLQEVVATVRDEAGHIVKGLRAEDFIIEENGARQTVAHFSADSGAPISLGVLIDSSASMQSMPGGTVSGLAAAVGITRVLLHFVKPTDEILLMSFGAGFAVKQRFTENHPRIEDALRKLEASGGMSVLQAIPLGLMEVRKAKNRKRALIVMTDAYFAGNLNAVASDVRQSEVPIFAFAMRGVDFGLQYPPGHSCATACHQFGTLPPRPMGGGFSDLTDPFFDTLARESGGRSTVFELHTQRTMERVNTALDDIAAELRGQYVLGYYPLKTGVAPAQRIRVRTNTPEHTVRIRRETP